MNYLSHFYLDKEVEQPYFTLGTALPDLHHGFTRIYNRKLRKADPENYKNVIFKYIHDGILRHYEVDSLFHESRFFLENVEIIKRKITDRIPKLQRAFFAAHILLEMLLDRQILMEEPVLLDKYYYKLEQTEEDVIFLFFEHHKIRISKKFFLRFNNFLNWKFLYQYEDPVLLARAFSEIYDRSIGVKLDQYSLETLVSVISDMDEILKHKWRNTFNQM